MSEKRFEVDIDHLLLVWDTEKNKRLEIENIVDRLNEFEAKCHNLEKENKELKEELQSVTMLKDDYEELIKSFKRNMGKLLKM